MKNWFYLNLICSLLLNCAYSKSIDATAFQKSLTEIFANDYNVQGSKTLTVKNKITKPSVGRSKVQELLAKNREKIKRMHPGKKKISMIKKRVDKKPVNDFFSKYKKEENQKFKQWGKSYDELVSRWDKDYQKYLKRVETYKANAEQVSDDKEILKRFKKEYKYTQVKVSTITELKLVEGAMDFDVKDQSQRPTCSAFAAVRAIEIKLRQKGRTDSLSEQYFYWSSKPKCREIKCSQRGSWSGYGFKYSKESTSKNIPRAQHCPYKKVSTFKNETQIPLSSMCRSGAAKVTGYTHLKNLDQVVSSIDQNNPVVAAITLDSRFYFNKGFIGKKNAIKGGKLDSHAKGHAILIVGYKKLPPKMKFQEGSLCFIIANSWGIGWGRAGHACVSEKWLLSHKRKTPFISVDSVI